MKTQIHILRATHWDTPGEKLHAFTTREAVERKAAEAVNMMLSGLNSRPLTASGWSIGLKFVQRYHPGCDVSVTTVELEG